jgi:metal-responsive CopG/Arc/MetJ family transcriptional regulator
MAHRARNKKSRDMGTRRASISLPAQLHQELEQIAKQKKVSLAWVMRDAAEAYVQNRWPLLAERA